MLDAFFLVSEDPVDDVEMQSANHGVVKRFPLFQRKKSLNLTQHGNSLTELITEFLNMVIKREFLVNQL